MPEGVEYVTDSYDALAALMRYAFAPNGASSSDLTSMKSSADLKSRSFLMVVISTHLSE